MSFYEKLNVVIVKVVGKRVIIIMRDLIDRVGGG
jgi:hypothetical protein